MNTKSSLFTCVIEEYDEANQFHYNEEHIRSYLENEDYISYWAFIKHDKDCDDEGEVKRTHYHLIIVCNNPYSKDRILSELSKNLVKSRNVLSVRSYNDVYQAVQYLIHANDKKKFQYDKSEIISSSSAETDIYLLGEFTLTIEKIIDIIKHSHNLKEVYITIGLKNAKLYHWIIKDLWKEHWESIMRDTEQQWK